MINSAKLYKELIRTGIQILGCNSNGIVWDMNNAEIQDRPDVQAVITAHDSTPEPEGLYHEFDKPVKAPDFIVASPKPKENPKEALLEALKESHKGQGVPKSSMTILLNLVIYIEDLEKRVDALEQ